MMNAQKPQKIDPATWHRYESLLDQVVETVVDAIVLIDRDRTVAFANAAAEDLFGVPRSELVGMPWRNRRWRATLPDGKPVPPDEAADLRVLERGESTFGMERMITRPDGSQVMVCGNAVPLRDDRANVIGMVISLTDTTYRTRTETELRRREEFYRALLENSSDATAVIDQNGIVLYMTSAVERISGHRPEEWIGKNGFEWVHPEDVGPTVDNLKLGLANPTQLFRRVLRLRHRDGSWRHVECVLSNRLADPAVQALVVNFWDVSEREAALAAVRRSEERYRVLFERNLAGVFRSRMDGTILDCNDSFARIFGFASSEEMRHARTHEFDRSSEDRKRFADALLAQGHLTNYESPMRRRDGTPIWILENVSLRHEGDDLVQEGTAIEITDRKRAEEQLRQASKMEAFGQLAGGVAHDFNNLLTALLGNLSLVLDRLPAAEPSRELLAEAERAGWRAAELTSQMLGFARRKSLNLEPINMLRGVAETVAILKRTLDPRITLEVKGAPDLWTVLADSGRLNQAVMNLCLNARDAMPHGGCITLQAENVTISPMVAGRNLDARPGDHVRLRVSDTGQGMPEEVRRRVFEPFFTTKPPGAGTGLGLAMVFGIVRQHSGWIECVSSPGKGTHFDIYLPRSLRSGTASAAPQSQVHGGTETILLVDDEPMIRTLGKTLLSQAGYQVLQAEDGAAAIEIFQREKGNIDLIVLDMTMPRLSGRDTFLALRKLDPHVRVIFSSGYSSEAMSSEIAATAAGFVSKPYRVSDLTRAIRSALDRPRVEKQAIS